MITTVDESYRTPGPAHTVVMGCSTHTQHAQSAPQPLGKETLALVDSDDRAAEAKQPSQQEQMMMMCFTEHSDKHGNRSQDAADPHNQLTAVFSGGKWLIRSEKGETLAQHTIFFFFNTGQQFTDKRETVYF